MFTYKGFGMTLEYDQETHSLYGRVTGCGSSVVDFHASKMEEIEDEFKKSVDDYLESICKTQP